MQIKPPNRATKQTKSAIRDTNGIAYELEDYRRYQGEVLVISIIEAIRNNAELRQELALALKDEIGNE